LEVEVGRKETEEQKQECNKIRSSMLAVALREISVDSATRRQ
jgi:hypothetical protein